MSSVLSSMHPETQQAEGFILGARLTMATFVLIHNTAHPASLEHRQSKAAPAYKVLWAYSSHCLPALKQIKCTCMEKRRWEGCGHGTGLNLHFSVQSWYFIVFPFTPVLIPLLTSWNKDAGFYTVQGWLSIWL